MPQVRSGWIFKSEEGMESGNLLQFCSGDKTWWASVYTFLFQYLSGHYDELELYWINCVDESREMENIFFIWRTNLDQMNRMASL